jgi:hypothetical protein
MLRRQFPVARRGVAICFAALAVLTGVAPEAARADIIAQNTGEVDSGTTVPGQSVTTPLGGPWDAITFNFFTNPTTPTASGTLFLLSKEYLGTPAALSSATSGFVAQSQSISGGKYIFDPGVTLQPNTQYFLYANASFLNSGGTHALYPGGNLYFANSGLCPRSVVRLAV